MKKMIGIVALLIALPLCQAIASSSGQAGAFLRMGLGARAIAMGNAFTGLGRDGFAGYYNPASLPFLNKPELAISYGYLSLDRNHNFIGFSTYIEPRSTRNKQKETMRAGLSLGWINKGVGNIDARDSDGNHLGMYSNSEHAFFFSFALEVIDHLGVGITGKIVNNRFPGILNNNETLSASGFGMDVGIYSTPFQNLSLGFVAKDLNTKYTWNTESLWERGSSTINHFPKTYRMGAAYSLFSRATLAGDLEYIEKQGWNFYAGAEIPYRNLFVARAGYNSDRITFGFGVQFNVWKYRGELSYAYDTISTTPSADQFFTWRLLF